MTPGAARVLERCDALARCSEEADRLTRRYATPALRAAADLVGGWMREAGLDVREDAAGNVLGRRAGEGPALLLGSHIDSVRDAGRYDGPLGVLAAIEIAERLRESALPFPLEVAAFCDEEGLRFGTTYLGSGALAGTLGAADLACTDEDGVSVAEAMRAYGGDPDGLGALARAPGELRGYVEMHIEQGPVLEEAGLPVGVVSAINGQTRLRARIEGTAGHAGTVPMEMRRDALAAAAELILAVERVARETPRLVATVGRLGVEPGAPNVIAGEVTVDVDVRHPDDAARTRACTEIYRAAVRLTGERRLGLSWLPLLEKSAVRCSLELSGALARAVEAAGGQVRYLPSGAGHDAVALAAVTPVAMLFVRCRGGVSHNPAEHVDEADVAVALDVLERFVRGLPAA